MTLVISIHILDGGFSKAFSLKKSGLIQKAKVDQLRPTLLDFSPAVDLFLESVASPKALRFSAFTTKTKLKYYFFNFGKIINNEVSV